MAEKQVFLIRHAQSEQNVATARLHQGHVSSLLRLASLGHDAPLSAAGQAQLAAARQAMVASDHRLDGVGVELVAHSPLQRARDTALALFGGGPTPMVEMPTLYERTAWETFASSSFDRRIAGVCAWLHGRNETRIALVGHGQFFKRALGLDAVQDNVAVLECSFSPTCGAPRARGAGGELRLVRALPPIAPTSPDEPSIELQPSKHCSSSSTAE